MSRPQHIQEQESMESADSSAGGSSRDRIAGYELVPASSRSTMPGHLPVFKPDMRSEGQSLDLNSESEHPQQAQTQLVVYDSNARKLVIQVQRRLPAAASRVDSTQPSNVSAAEDGANACPLCGQPRRAAATMSSGQLPSEYFRLLRKALPVSSGPAITIQTELPVSQELPTQQPLTSGEESSPNGQSPMSNSSPTTASTPAPGQWLSNGYYEKFFVEIENLGMGSFGSVHLCEHIVAGLQLGSFAVKKVGVGDNLPWLRRAMREVVALQQLQHPNVCRYYHCWLEQHAKSPFCPRIPHLFILMSYANKGSLDDHLKLGHPLKKRPWLSNECILEFLSDATSGLSAIHDAGFVHKDIKPGNMLIHDDGIHRPTLMITDLGEADWVMGGMKRSGHSGTRRFVPPEVAADHIGSSRWTAATDCWGLGMTLYCLMYSQIPLEEIDDDEFYSALERFGGIPPPPQRAAKEEFHRDKSLVQIMQGLLNPNPVHRLTAQQVAEHEIFQQQGVRMARGAHSSNVYSPRVHSFASTSVPTASMSPMRAGQHSGQELTISEQRGGIQMIDSAMLSTSPDSRSHKTPETMRLVPLAPLALPPPATSPPTHVPYRPRTRSISFGETNSRRQMYDAGEGVNSSETDLGSSIASRNDPRASVISERRARRPSLVEQARTGSSFAGPNARHSTDDAERDAEAVIQTLDGRAAAIASSFGEIGADRMHEGDGRRQSTPSKHFFLKEDSAHSKKGNLAKTMSLTPSDSPSEITAQVFLVSIAAFTAGFLFAKFSQ